MVANKRIKLHSTVTVTVSKTSRKIQFNTMQCNADRVNFEIVVGSPIYICSLFRC